VWVRAELARKKHQGGEMMKSQKLALPILAGIVVAVAACSSNYEVREAYGCTGPNAAETCKYPTYAQPVVIDGKAHPYLHYRDNVGGREFWLNGVWRKADPGQPYGRS